MARFRVTAWPDTPVGPEVVFVHPATLSDDGKTVIYDLDPGIVRELEPELCLRELLDLDTDNPSDLVDFVGRYGSIQRPWRNFDEPVIRWALHDRIGVQDLRSWLATAQSLSLSWVAHQEGRDFAELFMTAGRLIPARPPRADKHGVGEPDLWRALFPYLLNNGLREYHLRVDYAFDDDAEGFDVSFSVPDLYCAVCFQIHQLIVEDAPVRRCKNETCGRPFSKQVEGRAKYGQHRTVGVSFCSLACANAQSSRDYRRRHRKGGKK
jgi:hypothetical protein